MKPRGGSSIGSLQSRSATDGTWMIEAHSLSSQPSWSRTAAQANLVTKGREVAVDGQLTQNEHLSPDGRKQTRTAIRSDRLQLLGTAGDTEV